VNADSSLPKEFTAVIDSAALVDTTMPLFEREAARSEGGNPQGSV
jgi:hypothetical protein